MAIITHYGGMAMTIIKRGVSPQDQAMYDNALAATERNADLIEYISMMADIEIPTEEDDYEPEI
jgi:hypothetical protein